MICIICKKSFEGHFNRKLCSVECKKESKKIINDKYNKKKKKEKINEFEEKIKDKNEIWKPIKSFENYYISNLGRVKRHFINGGGFLLKNNKNKSGYLTVALCENGKSKTMLLHRLIAEAFIKNDKPEQYNIIDHINRIRDDNRIDNLRWCDYKINSSNSAKVINKKKYVLCETKDKINGSIYNGFRIFYYDEDNNKKSKRFKKKEDALNFSKSLL